MAKQIYYNNIRESIKHMNPRLKELAVVAGATPDGDTVICSSMDPAKFAELIVRECMSNLYLNGYDDAMIQIQKHFGVEE